MRYSRLLSAMSSARYSSALARLSRRSVVSHGRPDAASRRLGEQLRVEYLDVMNRQADEHDDQPQWFRDQLGGREIAEALSTALADVELPAAAEHSPATTAELQFTMQGRAYSFAASSETAIFVGREAHCDVVTTPATDLSVSRVSAILYPQPARGLLLICDPGNLQGIRVVSRKRAHLGLPQSVPNSRLVLPLAWGERADVNVCGVRVRLFPSDTPLDNASSDTPAAGVAVHTPLLAHRGTKRDVAVVAATVTFSDAAAAPASAPAAKRVRREPNAAADAASAVNAAASPTAAAAGAAADNLDSASASDAQSDARTTCRICLDQPRACCFVPCRHLICCIACAKKLLQAERPLCPSAGGRLRR